MIAGMAPGQLRMFNEARDQEKREKERQEEAKKNVKKGAAAMRAAMRLNSAKGKASFWS